MISEERLAVDLGNVIIDHVGFGTTDEYVNNGDYNQIPALNDAVSSLQKLNSEVFKNDVYVVYNATNVADSKIMTWLTHNNFFEMTGIDPTKIIRSESGRNKRPFCVKNKITHFIDDRLEVLTGLVGTVPNLYLLGGQPKEIELFKESLKNVYVAPDWKHILNLLINQRKFNAQRDC
jgi:hypothetical protein